MPKSKTKPKTIDPTAVSPGDVLWMTWKREAARITAIIEEWPADVKGYFLMQSLGLINDQLFDIPGQERTANLRRCRELLDGREDAKLDDEDDDDDSDHGRIAAQLREHIEQFGEDESGLSERQRKVRSSMKLSVKSAAQHDELMRRNKSSK